MQEYYQHDPLQPEKKGIGGYVATAIAAFFVGVLLTSLVMPAILNWQKIRETVQDLPSAAEEYQDVLPEQTQAPRAEREVPALGGNAPMINAQTPVEDIAEALGPSVVGVLNKVKILRSGERLRDNEQASGSGLVISKDGYIVTNYHVIQGNDTITVVLAGGEELEEAEVVGFDLYTDIAVLKVNKDDLTPAPIGDSDKVRVGQLAVAIGNPLGQQFAGSVTVGVISATNRAVWIDSQKHSLLQTDAAINPGNSGGPLVDGNGKVVGINTMKYYIAGYDDYGQVISSEGIGFAMPINQVMPIVEMLIKNGSIVRPGIGVKVFKPEPSDIELWGAPDGLMVNEVTSNGPAAVAGIKVDDIITECDGEAIDTSDGFVTLIQSHKVGDKLSIKLWRSGKILTVTVTIGDLNVINSSTKSETFIE